MSETLYTPASTRPRRPVACVPVRLRATITIDLEADDYLSAERLKAMIAAEYDLLRRTHPGAELDFRQRKPRTGRRAGGPVLIVDPYVDD